MGITGIGWALLAGLFFGLHQAVFRRSTARIDASRTTLFVLLVAGAFTSLLAVLTEDLGLLGAAGWWPVAVFAVTGILHFTVGWTLLGLSQQRIGAARTGIVIAANPLIGSVFAAVFLDEPLTIAILAGVIAVSMGVALIARERAPISRARTSGIPWHALLVATIWGITPVFIRWGLEDLSAPLIGVAIGMIAAAIAAALIVGSGVRPSSGGPVIQVLPWIVLGGVIVGTAIAAQWQSFDAIEISIAITLFQLSTPVVVFAAPIINRSPIERPTPTMLSGMAIIVGGALLVILS